MSDQLREWKCNTCKYPCTLIVNIDDAAPDYCPYSCERFEQWKVSENNTPKHETVSEWEERTGEVYPDDGPVWWYGKNNGKGNVPKNFGPHQELYHCVKDGKAFYDVLWVIVANHHGKPEVTDD